MREPKILDYTLPHIKEFAKQHVIEFEKRSDQYGFFVFGMPYGNNKIVRIESVANIVLEKLFEKQIKNAGRKTAEEWLV